MQIKVRLTITRQVVRYMCFILKLTCLFITAMGFHLNLTCLLITASVGVSAGLISYYFVLKNEKEVIASADDIYEDTDMDKVVIDSGDREVILLIRAEKRLLKILNERKKSSLLYI